MRRYIKQTIQNISRLRLHVVNDYVPIQRHPFIGVNWYRMIDCSFGKRNMGSHTVYAQIILFSYGFQLQRKGYA